MSQTTMDDNTTTATTAMNGGPRGGLRKRISRRHTQSRVNLPRLVERNLPFEQSRNRVSVHNERSQKRVYSLLVHDWFHVFLRLPVYFSVTLLLSIWTALILAFAGIYVAMDTSNESLDCGLGAPGQPIEWAAAFAFSLETCTTVGYGLPGSTNAYFEANCPSVQFFIYTQMTWSMMFNAFLFAFFFSTLAKCEHRSIQLLFSEKICINIKGDRVHLKAQCYDIDSKYPVVETHVRIYVMDKDLKLHLLRLEAPNDELGGMILTSLPARISHCIDHHSVLSPRGMPLVAESHCLDLRSADSATAGREEIVCPVCGEAYGTYERLKKHVEYNRIVEERDDYPKERSHLGFELPAIVPLTLDEVAKHIENTLSEIVVIVEGIDPQVSGTFQALQSYRFDDIAWEADFEPCLAVKNGGFTVDLDKFHQVRSPKEFLLEDSIQDDLETASIGPK